MNYCGSIAGEEIVDIRILFVKQKIQLSAIFYFRFTEGAVLKNSNIRISTNFNCSVKVRIFSCKGKGTVLCVQLT